MDTETMHGLSDFPLSPPPPPPPLLVMCCVFYKRVRIDSEYCLPVSGPKWIAHIPRVVQHALSYGGYHFRYVFVLKMLFIPPYSIFKHMRSPISPHGSPLSHFPESCITCKHDGVTSSCFKIS